MGIPAAETAQMAIALLTRDGASSAIRCVAMPVMECPIT